MESLPEGQLKYQEEHIHENKGPLLVAINIICVVLIISSLVARLISRKITGHALKLEDWTILVASFLLMGWFICGLIISTSAGVGQHAITMTPEKWDLLAKTVFASGLFYFPAYPMVKISILLLYQRMLGMEWFGWFRWAVRFMIAVNIGLVISTFFVSLLGCIPIAANWDAAAHEHAKCANLTVFILITSGLNAAIDIIILLLPLPIIWTLQMAKSKKIGTSILLMLGGATCVVSVVRIILNNQFNPYDATYSLYPTNIATNLEIGLAVTCANLATVRPLARAISSRASSGYSSYKKGSRDQQQMAENGQEFGRVDS